MTQAVAPYTQERTVTLEEILEQLLLIENLEASAIIAAVQAYSETMELLENKVILLSGKILYKVLEEASVPQFLISGVISNDLLRDYKF